MRILYDLFFMIFALLYLPCLFFRGRIHSGLLQKFGFLPDSVKDLDRPVWIHAVSVGEAVLAARLADAIKRNTNSVPVVVSTTTVTGNNMIRKLGKGSVDEVIYYPLDLSRVVSGVIKSISPRLYAVIETELWPNMLAAMKKCSVPVALVNGRISDRSYSNYKKIMPITRKMLGCIDIICVQTDNDALRLKDLGADDAKINVTGNIKFDEDVVSRREAGYNAEAFGWDPKARLIVAGSTHFPEEQYLINIYSNIRKGMKDVRLVIAPRHVERCEAVEVYAYGKGFSVKRFSELGTGEGGAADQADILLVDTIGHLKEIYSAATVVFIGGSLAGKGGQNPIEAAVKGKAVIFGPDMSNFREIAEVMSRYGAAVRTESVEETEAVMKRLLSDNEERTVMSGAASAVIDQNRGALDRTLRAIAGSLE